MAGYAERVSAEEWGRFATAIPIGPSRVAAARRIGGSVREAREEYGAPSPVAADVAGASAASAGTAELTAAVPEPSRTGTGPNEAHAENDPDALEELGDEIAVLSAHIYAATHRLLTLLSEFDRREGWKSGEYRSCADWLAFRTGIDRGAARQKVRVARALETLPQTSAAMARGELSFSKVRALARIATAENESELLEFARTNTAHQLEKLVRGWRDLNRDDEAERERRRHASRRFSIFPNERGMYEVRGVLDPEAAAALMRAVEQAGDALYREEARRSPLEPETTPEQRRADAVGLVAERAMAAGIGDGDEERDSDASPLSGSRAERYQVVLMVDPDTLTAGREPGRSHLDDGTRVSAEPSGHTRDARSAFVMATASSPKEKRPGACRATRAWYR